MDEATFRQLIEREDKYDCVDHDDVQLRGDGLGSETDVRVLAWSGISGEVCDVAVRPSETCLWLAALNRNICSVRVVFKATPTRGIVEFRARTATKWEDSFRVRWRHVRRPSIDTVEVPMPLQATRKNPSGYESLAIEGHVEPELRMPGDADDSEGYQDPEFVAEVQVKAAMAQNRQIPSGS